MKATKAQAHYRPGEGNRRCGNCTMFRTPSSCISVAGDIRPADQCDYFKPTKVEPMNYGAMINHARGHMGR